MQPINSWISRIHRFYPVHLLDWSICPYVADFRRMLAPEVDANQSHKSLRTPLRRNEVHQPWVGRHWTWAIDRVTVLICFPFILLSPVIDINIMETIVITSHIIDSLSKLDHVQAFESARSASNKIQILINSMDHMENISIYFRALNDDYLVVYHYDMLMQVLGYDTTIYSYAGRYKLHIWQTCNRA